MAMSPMVSLELSDDEKLDMTLPTGIADMPSYPWGTRICLTHRELEKLGLDAGDFAVGHTLGIMVCAEVIGVHSDKTDMGPQDRVELQITDLAMAGEDGEC